jgi:addiction module HigA family antidote
MTIHSPSHPGEIIREEVLKPLGLDVTKSAAVLGVTRPALSRLLNEKAALSPEMALRIEKAFGPKADHLMRIQLSYDMARARRNSELSRVSTEYVQRDPS